jgi:hypothetical protein
LIVPGAEAVRHVRKGQQYRHKDSVGADHDYTMKLFCFIFLRGATNLYCITNGAGK